MFRFLKELYFAEFTSFFKAGSDSWTPGFNAGKGTAGVVLFECIFFVGMCAWVEMIIGKRFLPNLEKWETWTIFLVIYYMNYYVLVIRGHGNKFEGEFENLEKSKKTILKVSCRVMELIIVVFFIYTISVYHHFFHIVSK